MFREKSEMRFLGKKNQATELPTVLVGNNESCVKVKTMVVVVDVFLTTHPPISPLIGGGIKWRRFFGLKKQHSHISQIMMQKFPIPETHGILR